MPHSKDPDRYDPAFANVLSYMEESQPIIRINCKTPTKALSFKMRLYGYAGAWKTEGLSLSKTNPELAKIALGRAKTMARYKLSNEGNFVICDSRDREDFEIPEIIVEGKVLEKLTPEEIQRAIIQAPSPTASLAMVPREKLSQANKSFLDLLDSVDRQDHEIGPLGPVDSERSDIEGEDDDGPNSGG